MNSPKKKDIIWKQCIKSARSQGANLILNYFNYLKWMYSLDLQGKENCPNVLLVFFSPSGKKKSAKAKTSCSISVCPPAACWMSSTGDWEQAAMVNLTLDLIAKSRSYLKKSRELSFPDYLMKLTHLHFSGKDIDDIVRFLSPFFF